MERVEALSALITLSQPLPEVRLAIGRFPWDSETELVTLTVDHVSSVLDRFMRGKLSAEDVKEWADLIEGRDDIALVGGKDGPIMAVIFTLANPGITESLTAGLAKRLRSSLSE
jgi:hypothetical protein